MDLYVYKNGSEKIDKKFKKLKKIWKRCIKRLKETMKAKIKIACNKRLSRQRRKEKKRSQNKLLSMTLRVQRFNYMYETVVSEHFQKSKLPIAKK